jgi:hypothetical protein
MREPRLGDDIDDFCVRCKRIMNHAVVSVLNQEPAKVRCRICHSDHDYRHEQAPPPKVDLRKQALFKEVLKKVEPEERAGLVDADVVDPPAEAVTDLADDAATEAATEATAEAAAVPASPKPKSKSKLRK